MKGITSWKNGEYITNNQLGISAWDAHFFFGWAAFDAFRTYGHKLFNIDYHLDRFLKSSKLIGIDIKYSKNEIKQTIENLMDINKGFFEGDEYRFMIFSTPGRFKIYEDMGDTDPNLTIQLTTTSRYAKFIYPNLERGWTSLITHQKQIPSRFFDVRIKSCSRLHYGLADLECRKINEPTNPILLDEHGNICESSGSNIAFIKGNTLHIPHGTDMLQGNTIRVLESLAKSADMVIKKGIYKPYDLIDCDCILYTSTYSGITPSYKLIYNDRTYNLNKNNKYYKRIMDIFSKHVGIDVIEQWKNWYNE